MSYDLSSFARTVAPHGARYLILPAGKDLPAFSDGAAAVFHPDAPKMHSYRSVTARDAHKPSDLRRGKPTHRVTRAAVMKLPTLAYDRNGIEKRTFVRVGDAVVDTALLRRVMGPADDASVRVVLRGPRRGIVLRGNGWRATVMPLDPDDATSGGRAICAGRLRLSEIA